MTRTGRTQALALGIWSWAWLAGAWGAPSAPAAAQVRVETVPPGATILCDGVPRDVAPLTLSLDAGDHLIVATKSGYIEARKTIQTAPRQRTIVNLQLDPLTGLILIDSVPPGADIDINGAHRGKTPLLVTDLPIGQYRVAAVSPGYARREVDLAVEDRTPKRLVISLVSDSAMLTVSSEPTGAVVTIDGTQRGTTPCDVDRVAAGEHSVTVALDKYRPWTETLKVQAGDTLKVAATLEAQPAKLRVTSDPAGAKVYVNDEPRGQTPLLIESVAPGTCTVRAELAGYESQTQEVTVAAAEEKALVLTLVRNAGNLEVMTAPAGAKVVLDGQERGVTAASEIEGKSAPLRLDDVTAGPHRLQLVAKGFFPVERMVMIVRGDTTNVQEVLRRKFEPNAVVRTKSGDAIVGYLSQKQPNGDVELETSLGIFRSFKAADVVSVDPVAAEAK